MAAVQDAEYRNTEAEFREICDFLDAVSLEDPFIHWDSGTMRYWRHELHCDKDPQDPFFRENAHVWRREGAGIVGLCISEDGRNDVFVEVLPAHREIYSIILGWIEGTWAVARDTVEIDIFADDERKLHLLQGAGYVFAKHSRNMRTYDLDRVDLDYSMEPGYSIRAFSESPDVEGRIVLVQSAFDNPAYSEKRLRGLLASPAYEGAWDLMVLSGDGTPVSFCVGWREPTTADAGNIEPVGTHAEYRRRGLAQAVVRECFARMRAAGIRTVRIASVAEPAVGNFLYDSLSPSTKREVHRYAKTFRES